MNDALQTAIGPLIAALIAFLGIVYTQRQARAAQKKSVDAEAYMRARQFDDAAILRMQAEVKEAARQLDEVRRQQAQDRERHEQEMRAKEIALANIQDDWRAVLQLHAAWDLLAVQHLAGVEHGLPHPPPLYPPAHVRRTHVEGEDGTLGS